MLSSALCFGCWNARSKCVECESDANYATTTPEDTGGGSSPDDSPSPSADESSSSAVNRGRYYLALMQTSTDTSMDQNHNSDVVNDIQVSQQLSGPPPTTASDHHQQEDGEDAPPPLVEIGDELRSVHQDIPFTDNMGQNVESMPWIPCDSPVDRPTTATHGTYCKFS
jgi:hypothetical protein